MTATMFPLLFSCGESYRSSNSSIDQDAIKSLEKDLMDKYYFKVMPTMKAKRGHVLFNPTMDKNPTIIATCKKEEDIVRSVDFAREHQLEIAVRSDNHGNMGGALVKRVYK